MIRSPSPADAVEGLVAAHPEELLQVHGGVVRKNATVKGQPALVVGGGSGHYPAFAGWAGPGLRARRPLRQHLLLAVLRPGLLGGEERRERRGSDPRLRPLRGRRAPLRRRRGEAARRGHRCAHRRGQRRRGLRGEGGPPRPPRHRRRPHGVQDRRRRDPGRRGPRGGRAPGLEGERRRRGPSGSRSTAVRCPAPTMRCSTSPRGRWPSAWASTASPGSTRWTCRRPRSSRRCSWTAC